MKILSRISIMKKKAPENAAKKKKRKTTKRVRISKKSEKSGRKLSLREQKFVTHYTELMSGTAAMIALGASPKQAGGRATAMLKDPDIVQAIEARIEYQSARSNMTKERISNMLLDVYVEARQSADLTNARNVAMDLAKLHGLITIKTQAEVTFRLEDMDEKGIKQFLGAQFSQETVDAIDADFTEIDIKKISKSKVKPKAVRKKNV